MSFIAITTVHIGAQEGKQILNKSYDPFYPAKNEDLFKWNCLVKSTIYDNVHSINNVVKSWVQSIVALVLFLWLIIVFLPVESKNT